MRIFLKTMAALLILTLSSTPASAFWLHHSHVHHQPVLVTAPAGVAPQGVFQNLVLPLLMNQLGQLGQPGQPGQSLASTPVSADVAKQLTDADTKIKDVLERSRTLRQDVLPDKELIGPPKTDKKDK